MLTGFFMNFELLPDFDRLCKLGINKQKIILKSSRHKPLDQFQPKLAWMVLRWSPFKIVSGSSILYPRWLPLLKIQIMSNGQNCCIWSHDGLKFVLYEHNYVLFSSPDHRPYELLPSGFVRRPLTSVVSFSHFNLFLRKHWANLDQTWMTLFQNCVRQLCRPFKMATITKYI